MGTGRKFNKKPVSRPKKGERERKRRIKTHEKRLVAAGASEEEVKHMTPKAMRAALREVAKKSGAAA